MPVSLCPLTVQSVTHHPSPTAQDPAGLSYSFTVPGEPRSAGIARSNVHTALHAHGLGELEEPALHVASELVACGALFAPGQDLYYSVRWRDGTLRIVNWDPHHSHSAPDLAASCRARRKRQLLLLACIVRECDGSWGITKPAPATEGTRVWADLPHAGTAAYAARRC
ncbi:ATP-binding protein [Streptomyces syringium]|uniref:ATP-binding protein n=1 Tax=Streptomyces syringium TaxID=76729 RepID=UPI003D9112EB